ncbi:MAG: hypothetical protein KJZ80_14305 [Hyphomicrobiaceae bacterium]|nr:hypothetical protein [Hyphomicrobiaceae bacterium]
MATTVHGYRGSCHCGAISVVLSLPRPAPEMRLRSCQCGFCRPRGTRTVADPAGSAAIFMASPGQVRRYRFGLNTADYLLCATCGSYVGAVQEEAGGPISVINVGGLDIPGFRGLDADPVSYDGEAAADRVARRRTYWMPTTIILGSGQA